VVPKESAEYITSIYLWQAKSNCDWIQSSTESHQWIDSNTKWFDSGSAWFDNDCIQNSSSL